MFESKYKALDKVNKTDITKIKKEIIFYNLFEYELKTFIETEKNSKNLKTLVSQLVHNNITLEHVKRVLIHKDDQKLYNNLIKIGRIDNSYVLYLQVLS